MQIVINGSSAEGDYTTVDELLKERGIAPYRVVVELNGKILPKADYASTKLQEGDTLEIVEFVAGG